MGAFMDRYNRMKGIGTVPDTVQAEGEDSSSVPASEVSRARSRSDTTSFLRRAPRT